MVQLDGRAVYNPFWTLSQPQSAWASVSRAVRTPNLSEDALGSNQTPAAPGVFPRAVGSRDFESERLWAYELGYRAQATERISVDVALFYNVYENLRTSLAQLSVAGPVPGTRIIPIVFENRMKAESYGAEISATAKLTGAWKLFGAYSLLKMHLHADPSLPAGIRLEAEGLEGQSPQNQVYVQSSWDLLGNVELDLMGRYVDGLELFNPTNTPAILGVTFPNVVSPYVGLDARGAWRPRKHWEVAVVGQNLFDNHHPESGVSALLKAPQVEICRSVYLTVSYSW